MVETRRRAYSDPDLSRDLATEPIAPPVVMADRTPASPTESQDRPRRRSTEEEQDRQVGLPKDATKLPIFRGDEEDVPNL